MRFSPDRALSRRSFLGATALAAAPIVFGRSHDAFASSQHAGPPGFADFHSRLVGCAFTGARYVGLFSLEGGAHLFQLAVDGSGAVSLAEPVPTGIPAAFSPSRLAAHGEELYISGSLPYEHERLVVDDNISGLSAKAVRDLPREFGRGVHEIVVMGRRPLLYRVTNAGTQIVPLPQLSSSPISAVASDISVLEVDRGADLVVLIEHNPYSETSYDSAATVLKRASGQWVEVTVARDLGEGGLSRLSASRERMVVAVQPGNADSRMYEYNSNTASWDVVSSLQGLLVMALASGRDGSAQALALGPTGRVRRWESPGRDAAWAELPAPPNGQVPYRAAHPIVGAVDPQWILSSDSELRLFD